MKKSIAVAIATIGSTVAKAHDLPLLHIHGDHAPHGGSAQGVAWLIAGLAITSGVVALINAARTVEAKRKKKDGDDQ